MARRIPLIVTLLACAVTAGAIALVYVLVIAGLVYGGIDLPGQPEIADADTNTLGVAVVLPAA